MTASRGLLVLAAALPFLLGNQSYPSPGAPGRAATVIARAPASLPLPDGVSAGTRPLFQYVLRYDEPPRWLDGTDLTVYTDLLELAVGSRLRFSFMVTITDKTGVGDYSEVLARPIVLGPCDIHAINLPARAPPARGCGHCGAAAPSDAAPLALALAAWVGITVRRRRRRA